MYDPVLILLFQQMIFQQIENERYIIYEGRIFCKLFANTSMFVFNKPQNQRSAKSVYFSMSTIIFLGLSL